MTTWRGTLIRWLVWLGRHEHLSLGLVVLIAAAAWGFAELADEVVEGDTSGFDRTVLLAMRSATDLGDPWGPRWVEELARDVTALGGMGILTFVTAAVCGFLWLEGKRRSMLLMLIAVVGGIGLSLLLKEGFARPRPELVPTLSHVYTASFPSGHAMMSAVTYLTLGFLLARFHGRSLIKVYVIGLAVLLTVAVGLSRVYVGVHWPTDVLAGWAVGAAWALLCWLVARWLQQRGRVEQEAEAADLEQLALETPLRKRPSAR